MGKNAVKPYHHGNLRNEFIEKGLAYIEEYGVESLSMRKLAEVIGVSSAAPYAHFKNKDAFLDAVRDYIAEILTVALQATLDANQKPEKILMELGMCYIFFFYKNPLYYQFLFTRGELDLHTNQAFRLFEEVSAKTLLANKKSKLNTDTIRYKTLAMWALVQGLVQIAMMKGVLDEEHLPEEMEAIIRSMEV